MKKLLLIGHPNAGKTAIFNQLCGENRKVANYSGITVDTAVGTLQSDSKEEDIQVVDLPGIYSLVPSSPDEGVTLLALLGENPKVGTYDDILVVFDLQRFDTSMAMVLAIKEVFGDNFKLVFNKTDMFKNQFDLTGLGHYLKVPTLEYSILKGNVRDLKNFVTTNIKSHPLTLNKVINLPHSAKEFLHESFLKSKGVDKVHFTSNEIFSMNDVEKYQMKGRDLKANYFTGDNKKLIKVSNFIDKIALHPLWGGALFFLIFYFIFLALYEFSGPLMDGLEGLVSMLGTYVGGILPEGEFNSFMVDGVIAGVGGVVVFLPQIMILFFLLGILEQSGYIARASIITDRMMSFFGLGGKAFLPFMSGLACSVPAIMSTRTIANKTERMATLMVLPLITCSARLPVYVLLIGTFIPEETILGIFNSQALAFFFLYFLGTIVALIMALVFRLSFFKGKSTSFVIELPVYQFPSMKMLVRNTTLRGKIFLKKAGTIILGLSIIIWALSTYPKVDEQKLAAASEEMQASMSLEYSVMGRLGKAIEPVIKPLGYDWKMGVGLLIAFGARELFVSAMGTIYALGDVDEESSTLRERLLGERDPITGKPVFNLAVSWSLLIFFAFACQCVSTLAIVRRETESYLYPAAMFGYMSVLAYGGAWVAYNLVL
jgi:ferrous iron transport protein B